MKRIYFILTTCIAFVLGCDNDDDKFSFEPALGFAEVSGSVSSSNTSGIRVEFYSNVTITEPVTVKVLVNNVENLTYGVDYTTDPEPVDGIITVTIDPEDARPSFFVIPKVADEEIRNINFQIIEVSGNGLRLGQSLTLNYVLSITSIEEVNLTYNFNTCATTPEGFTEAIVPTAGILVNTWGCSSFGYPSETTKCAEANAFGKSGSGASNAYLIISSPLTPGSYTIDAMVYSRYTGAGAIKFRYSTNYTGSGNPEASGVTWTDITSINSNLPAAGSQTWKAVSGIVSGTSGNIYLAIQYAGGTSGSASNWRIDDLKISN